MGHARSCLAGGGQADFVWFFLVVNKGNPRPSIFILCSPDCITPENAVQNFFTVIRYSDRVSFIGVSGSSSKMPLSSVSGACGPMANESSFPGTELSSVNMLSVPAVPTLLSRVSIVPSKRPVMFVSS